MLQSLSGLWERRELVWHLSMTDLKLRYRNSLLGFAWTILEPLLLLTVLYLVFTNIFKTDIENYALYLLIGIVTWNMFSRGTSMNNVSILHKSGIISSLFFPREILVLSTTITAFIMMTLEFIVIGAFFVGTQFLPPLTGVAIIPILGILFFLTLATSMMLSVLNVHFRDIGVIWTVVLQIGFFASPIIYKIDFLPEKIQAVILLNPVAHVIEAVHNLLLYATIPTVESISYMIGSTVIMFVIGLIVFRHFNPKIVEYL